MEERVVKRFLKYTGYNTRSEPGSNRTPSSEGQLVFGLMLAEELRRIGLSEVEVDNHGYVMASLPANCSENIPVIGFIAHMDTSPDFSSEGVKARFIENYDGNDLLLNKEQNIVLSPNRFPELLRYTGQRLIVTDGTTLLGADDKAGLAEIITSMEYLINHPEIKHGKIRIAFTPDEEIGQGADHFYTGKFGADFAYTLDGGEIGELQYENFNAAAVQVVFHGVSVHPGSAKGKMRNSILMANHFLAQLPEKEIPQETEGYEGFFHLTDFQGSVEKTELHFIVRDFDRTNFEKRKQLMLKLVTDLNSINGENVAEFFCKDQYYNMKEKIDPVFYIVDLAKEAMLSCDIVPKIVPVRGGTDGSRLSYMGLPCPNIFAGGHNFHGPYEFIPTKSMESACRVIVEICRKSVSYPFPFNP